MHGDGVEPIEEILAHRVGGDHRPQIAVGRRHDARVHPPHRRGAHAAEGALLEKREQLRLRAEREVADLVEEQGPSVGDLDQAQLPLARVREGAALVAEQLALDQRLGNGGAVQLHERTGRARRAVVQHARDRLLAGAALSRDQHHRHGARGDHLHLAQQLRHARRGVNEGVAVGALALLRRHVGDPLLQRARPRGVADGRDDLVQLERLLDEVVAAQLHRGRPRSRWNRAPR